jgi:hypothetical protein
MDKAVYKSGLKPPYSPPSPSMLQHLGFLDAHFLACVLEFGTDDPNYLWLFYFMPAIWNEWEERNRIYEENGHNPPVSISELHGDTESGVDDGHGIILKTPLALEVNHSGLVGRCIIFSQKDPLAGDIEEAVSHYLVGSGRSGVRSGIYPHAFMTGPLQFGNAHHNPQHNFVEVSFIDISIAAQFPFICG